MEKFFLITLLFTTMVNPSQAESKDPYLAQRQRMIETQIRKRGIRDEGVLQAMLKVKRHLFVPKNAWPSAYADHPLGIGYGQTISQPFIVAFMTEILNLKSSDTVLEIGTGSGYQAAVLAEIVDKVYTIEIVEPLAVQAQARLKELGYENIQVKHGDGFAGWTEFAPFDAIIVTAAPAEIPPQLMEQLKPLGRMIIPVGDFYQELYLITKTETGVSQKSVLPVRFVPMVKE